MSDYPKASKLLLQLMAVPRQDRDMPLPILINLHRNQLRRPMLGLLPMAKRYAGSRYVVHSVKQLLASEYPQLISGYLFKHCAELNSLPDRNEMLTPAGREQLDKADAVLRMLYKDADMEWSVHEPLVLLYTLSLPGAQTGPLLQALEIELGLNYQVRQMIRKYARLGRKTA